VYSRGHLERHQLAPSDCRRSVSEAFDQPLFVVETGLVGDGLPHFFGIAKTPDPQDLPFGLRFAVAFDRELCRQVRGVFMDTVLATLRLRARRQGIAKGQSGAVVFVQRFGGAINLNVHFHALVLDGVFHDEDADVAKNEGAGRPPTFRVTRRLRDGELADVLQTIEAKIGGLLKRRQLDAESALDELAERSPELATAQAASIQGRLAFGPHRGQRVTRVGSGSETGRQWTQPSRARRTMATRCTRVCASPARIVRGSNACVATWRGRPSRPSDSPSCPMDASPTTCATPGRTARRASCSNRSHSSRSWRR